MSGPVTSWQTAPVWGTWLNYDGSLKAGAFTIMLPVRVTNTPDDSIFPSGIFHSDALDTTSGHRSIDVNMPLTDDPDNLPAAWQAVIIVTFEDHSATETYTIDIPTSSLPAGVNLRTIQVPKLG